ncbi:MULTISPECIES: hypothetical protein [Cellulophaga]|jgi:hypothetical protein|uniref:Uncharacterized protein n=2 Tax=Cellulophaga baltica TaxID=76594 RepID=A0A1G7LD42_9FLAO|nr:MULTISPECIES: hypothetical protein [Cellulophaga]AIY14051.1 hypothetical protein M667_13045 [Cellulophaga baltica NN016038]AIZ42397.1 hypothetical protein M666_12895 [Cellulophaga baltica 18]KGK29986.1 hypothetical protein EL45_12335 [Cellulophaga sp. E6(2014)]MBA6316279.1 hypothetical protein [Cellulophaga baltica]MCR1026666.1 hypothetical protein [Cellulophaga baltica]
MKNTHKIKSLIFLVAFIGTALYYNASQKNESDPTIKNTEYQSNKKELTLKKDKLITAVYSKN